MERAGDARTTAAVVRAAASREPTGRFKPEERDDSQTDTGGDRRDRAGWRVLPRQQIPLASAGHLDDSDGGHNRSTRGESHQPDRGTDRAARFARGRYGRTRP